MCWEKYSNSNLRWMYAVKNSGTWYSTCAKRKWICSMQKNWFQVANYDNSYTYCFSQWIHTTYGFVVKDPIPAWCLTTGIHWSQQEEHWCRSLCQLWMWNIWSGHVAPFNHEGISSGHCQGIQELKSHRRQLPAWVSGPKYTWTGHSGVPELVGEPLCWRAALGA